MAETFPIKLFITELYTDMKTDKYKVKLYLIQIPQKFNFSFIPYSFLTTYFNTPSKCLKTTCKYLYIVPYEIM